jgi:glycosyltransferase involved in cell wall biosynthesis
VVHHERNGLLVPVREARGLADALERLILDPELRLRLGACGRERAEKEYSSDIVNERIVSTYFEMLAARGQQ